MTAVVFGDEKSPTPTPRTARITMIAATGVRERGKAEEAGGRERESSCGDEPGAYPVGEAARHRSDEDLDDRLDQEEGACGGGFVATDVLEIEGEEEPDRIRGAVVDQGGEV